MITPSQMRAARAILDLTQGEAAEKLGIAANTLSKIESGQSDPPASRVRDIQEFYENSGVEFFGNEGVQKKKGEIRSFRGRSGFLEFYKLVLKVAEEEGGKFCISNVDEALFDFWLGSELDAYVERIQSLKNVSFSVLLREGDYNFAASNYAEYRWIPEKEFTNVPFYLFGKNLAMILFKGHEDVSVYLIQEQEITEAQYQVFDYIWKNAKEVPLP